MTLPPMCGCSRPSWQPNISKSVTASSGPEALEIINRNAPDIVLLGRDDAGDGRVRGLLPDPRQSQDAFPARW